LVQTFGFGAEERLERLLAKEPSCVIVSTTFILLDRISALGEIREKVRRLSPRTKVVAGGSSLHWCVKTYPEFVPYILDFCDVIVDDAQGLGTLCRLIEGLKRGEELEAVPNLIYSRRGRMVRTQREQERISINELAPDWTRWIPRNYKGRVRLQTSQGCPYQCRFCDFRLRNRTECKSLEVLRNELRALSSIGVAKLDFIDDLFTLPEQRLRSICRMMLDEKFNFRWFCLSRSSGLSADTVRLMAEAGCEMVNIGMESAAPEILRNMDKRTNVEESYAQMEEFRRHGITVFCNFILGFPGETDETIGQTLHFLNTAAIDAYFLILFVSARSTKADAQEFRKEFKLKGEYLGWRHATGSASEFANKMNDFVSRVSSRVLRVGGLEEVCMLLDDGYTPAEMRALAPIIKGLAEWKRGNGIRPEDREKSLKLLEGLKAFEETRRRNNPCAANSGGAKPNWRRTSQPMTLSGAPKIL
jgi:p-methyltransferase